MSPVFFLKADFVRRSPTVLYQKNTTVTEQSSKLNPDSAKATSGKGGESEIRTRGALRLGGLVNRCTRPLCDLSLANKCYPTSEIVPLG